MTKAIFEGLVFDEQNHPATVAYVGSDPTYVIIEDGFRFHVDARSVDDRILEIFRAQINGNRDEIGTGVMRIIGKDDLFSKAAIMSTLQNLDKEMALLREVGLPLQAREYLGMMGLRFVINRHGDVLDINLPTAPEDDEP
jgi:hypothetical protein